MLSAAIKKNTQAITFGVVLLALIVGAGYRISNAVDNFHVTNGFEFFVNMASHFWTDPAGYNFEDGLKMKADADNYVFTRYPKEAATGSFENEKGWAFILSVILPESQKGMRNLALTVVRYQIMLDLLVIVVLFFCARSIAGLLGGAFAAFLYAVFTPSIDISCWAAYYYWATPLAAVSLLFWTTVYKPETRAYSLKLSAVLFFVYGMLMGFATAVRLNFVFLPLFMAPIIFLRERDRKRALVLIVAMLIGQSLLLAPQVYLTHKFYGKWSLSVRGKWHAVIQGLGAYPNPWGVTDATDDFAKKWAVERGGPDITGRNPGVSATIREYDGFMRKKAMQFFKENPGIFYRNACINIRSALGMHWQLKGGPMFFGVPRIVPWVFLLMTFISTLALFFLNRGIFKIMLSVIAQGIYSIFILCLYFQSSASHMTAYFPVFVLLVAASLAVTIELFLDLAGGLIRRSITALRRK